MTLDEAVVAWKSSNPFPAIVVVDGVQRATTQDEYDAMALDRGQMALDAFNRKLAGQAEIEALGFTVTQVRTVYQNLKAGTATNVQAQKALAGVMRYLWRDLLNDP